MALLWVSPIRDPSIISANEIFCQHGHPEVSTPTDSCRAGQTWSSVEGAIGGVAQHQRET